MILFTKISFQFARPALLIWFLALHITLHAQWTTRKTPMGQTVDVLIRPHNQTDTDIVTQYHDGLIQQNNWHPVSVGSATTQYQCHGYAWHMYNKSTLNNYTPVDPVEINDGVLKYLINDAVEEIPALNPTTNWVEGVVIVYGGNWGPGVQYPNTPEHSAVTTSEPGYVVSKWYWGNLYKHKIDECPWGSKPKRYYKVNITGADKICSYNGSANYTTKVISNATYTWKAFNTTVGNNSSSINITNNFSAGSGMIKVSIYSPASETTIKGWKKLCVGESNSGYVPGGTYTISGGANYNNSLCPYTDYTIYVNSPCSASNYTWTLPPGFTINYISGNMMSFNTGYGSSGELVGRANVWCSETPTNCCPPPAGSNAIVVYASVNANYPYCNSWLMSVSPNPATDYVDIEATKETDKTSEEDSDESYQLTIYNSMRIPVYEVKDHKSKKLNINTRQFPNGVYVARFVGGKQTIVKRFIVSH